MKLQKCPGLQCTIVSTAMLLNEPAADLVTEIGHDGGTPPGVEWEGIVRGYHMQELIDLLYRRGLAATPIEIFPVSMDTQGRHWLGHHLSNQDVRRRFYDTLETSRGLIEGQSLTCGHMVAYDHGHVYDPNGYDYPYECFSIYNFKPLCAWRVDAILPGKA